MGILWARKTNIAAAGFLGPTTTTSKSARFRNWNEEEEILFELSTDLSSLNPPSQRPSRMQMNFRRCQILNFIFVFLGANILFRSEKVCWQINGGCRLTAFFKSYDG